MTGRGTERAGHVRESRDVPVLRRKTVAGFTLLELLIAIGLVAILSGLMLQSMRLTFAARETITRIEDLNHAAQVALKHIASDISMAYLSNHVNPEEPATETLFDGTSDSLMFTYLGHERRRRGARESDQGLVEYRLESDPDGPGRVLVRRGKAMVDDQPDKGGVREELVSGVREFRLQYWDDDKDDWKDEWQAEMEDAARSGLGGSLGSPVAPVGAALMKAAQEKMLEEFKLPSRVYVRLVLLDSLENEHVFETQSRIHLQFPLNF